MNLRQISIDQIQAFQIGHAQDYKNGTGCTVILAPQGARAGVDVRGGGPATRETDLLDPKNMVEDIHAVTLSGGSAFGLEAASGVMDYLSQQQIGFSMKDITIPIVCQASLFDCNVANAKAYPDKAMGYQACLQAQDFDRKMGNIGAGTGASVGKCFGFDKAMKSGLGHAAFQLGDLQVGALVAVNACGDVFYPNSQEQLAGAYNYQTHQLIPTEKTLLDQWESLSSGQGMTNTTIGCILTNANLTKAELCKLAGVSHNAYAHCIRPVHTSNDGDTIFTMASKEIEAPMDIVAIIAIHAMEQAIVNALKSAEDAYGLLSHQSLKKARQ